MPIEASPTSNWQMYSAVMLNWTPILRLPSVGRKSVLASNKAIHVRLNRTANHSPQNVPTQAQQPQLRPSSPTAQNQRSPSRNRPATRRRPPLGVSRPQQDLRLLLK